MLNIAGAANDVVDTNNQEIAEIYESSNSDRENNVNSGNRSFPDTPVIA
jgi:hypothetical protein